MNFHMTLTALLLITSSLLPCLFSMPLNEDIIDIEKPDGMYLHTFVVEEFSWLFLHLLIFSIMHSKSVHIINGALSDF